MAAKLISWNVNGIRAVAKKGFQKTLEELDPDILCLQETKAQDDQVREVLFGIGDYNVYSNSAERKGYSGTAILSKEEPLDVVADMGIEEHDNEGRVLTAEYEKFYVVNVYVPNSGRGLPRLDYRKKWDRDFLQYLKKLNEKKPLMVCGDLNVAHQAIDLANPKSNYNKTAGYTQVEIDGLSEFLNEGFTDTFRHFYPDKTGSYSWWSYRFGAREKNIGWRLDYFLACPEIMKLVKDAFILPECQGSDHCPIGIYLEN